MAVYESMTDEQLLSCLHAGETEIMNYLMAKYKPVVRKKAREMFLIGGERDDLIQEGMIGLLKAVQSYDETQGNSFHSFAGLCISRQMYSAIEASKRKKHLPLNSYVSIYETEGEGEESGELPLIDVICSEVDNSPEALYFRKEYMEALIEKLKESLSALENRVLYLHLLGTDYRTIAEILNKNPKTIDNALQRIKTKAGRLLPRE